MLSIITSYLLQSKECTLPGIGNLKIKIIPAKADVANKQILPPRNEIIFSERENGINTGLLKYISKRKNIDDKSAENLLNKFCKDWKEKIDAGEELKFETIGSLKKDSEGNIYFEEDKNFNFLQPVRVERMYEKEEPATIVLHEETKTVEDIYENEKIITERSGWGIWAIILIAVASVAIFYHFYNHKLTSSSIGNQNHFSIDSADVRYTVPE